MSDRISASHAPDRSPFFDRSGERVKIRCSTLGCGRKLLAEQAPATAIVAGWIELYCSRCKTTYRLEADQETDAAEMPLAS